MKFRIDAVPCTPLPSWAPCCMRNFRGRVQPPPASRQCIRCRSSTFGKMTEHRHHKSRFPNVLSRHPLNSRVFALPVILPILEPAPVRVPVRVGHVSDAVPPTVLVLSDVGVAVRPVVLPGAVEQAVPNLSHVSVIRLRCITSLSGRSSLLPYRFSLNVANKSKTFTSIAPFLFLFIILFNCTSLRSSSTWSRFRGGFRAQSRRCSWPCRWGRRRNR